MEKALNGEVESFLAQAYVTQQSRNGAVVNMGCSEWETVDESWLARITSYTQ